MREKFKTCTYDSLNFAALDFFIQKIIMSFFMKNFEVFCSKGYDFQETITPKSTPCTCIFLRREAKPSSSEDCFCVPPFPYFLCSPSNVQKLERNSIFHKGLVWQYWQVGVVVCMSVVVVHSVLCLAAWGDEIFIAVQQYMTIWLWLNEKTSNDCKHTNHVFSF